MLNNVPESDNFSYDYVASVIAKTGTSLLPKKEQAQAGWFKGNETVLLPLMKSRKSAMADVFKRQTRSITLRLRFTHIFMARYDSREQIREFPVNVIL